MGWGGRLAATVTVAAVAALGVSGCGGMAAGASGGRAPARSEAAPSTPAVTAATFGRPAQAGGLCAAVPEAVFVRLGLMAGPCTDRSGPPGLVDDGGELDTYFAADDFSHAAWGSESPAGRPRGEVMGVGPARLRRVDRLAAAEAAVMAAGAGTDSSGDAEVVVDGYRGLWVKVASTLYVQVGPVFAYVSVFPSAREVTCAALMRALIGDGIGR
jgi:hypothetical protein